MCSQGIQALPMLQQYADHLTRAARVPTVPSTLQANLAHAEASMLSENDFQLPQGLESPQGLRDPRVGPFGRQNGPLNHPDALDFRDAAQAEGPESTPESKGNHPEPVSSL